MDKRDLFTGDTHLHKLLTDVVVYGEILCGVILDLIHHLFQSMKLRAVDVACGVLLGRCCFRCGQVAEDELRQFVLFAFLPDAEHIVHAHIDLAHRLVREVGIDDALVKSQFATIRGNLQHVIDRSIHNTGMNFACSLRKLLHHRCLDLGRLCHLVMVDRSRRGQIQLIRRLDVCHFFEKGHQFGQIEELGKPRSRTISGSLRCQLDGCRGFAKGRCPTVEVGKAFFTKGIVLEVAHHGIQFCHGVGYRRTCGKDNSLAPGDLVDVSALQIHIRGLLCIRRRKPRNIAHFCVEEHIFVIMCLVHIQTIYAQLLKGNDIIFAPIVLQFL